MTKKNKLSKGSKSIIRLRGIIINQQYQELAIMTLDNIKLIWDLIVDSNCLKEKNIPVNSLKIYSND